jgi:hypothetical protein
MKPTFAVVEGDESIKQLFGDVDRIPTVFVFDRNATSRLSFKLLRGATKKPPTNTSFARRCSTP